MDSAFSRTERLLGADAMQKLREARVAVFGLGGVGSYAAEALVRSGVGALDLIDHDRVSISNLNRQLIALRDTIGRYKADVAKERCLAVNPEAVIRAYRCFYLPENSSQFDFTEYDYVIDAIDTVSAKIALVMQAKQSGTPVISAMGAGNKLDPTAFEVADISHTSVCPLARVMRRELRKRGVRHLKVVYSREEVRSPLDAPAEEAGEETAESGAEERKGSSRRQTPGSVSFVPSVAGLILAGEVIRDLAGIGNRAEQ